MARTVYAWRSFYGKRKDGTIVQGIIPQFDGSAHAGANCGAASEAMRVVSQKQSMRPGKGSPWYPSGASIRRKTGDTSGGLMPSQTTRASYNEYGVPHATPRIDTWSKVTEALFGGYAVDLLVGYGPIDDWKSGSPGFRGNHRVVLVGIKENEGSTFSILMADPLYDGRRAGIPKGQQWAPATVVRKAAGQLKVDGFHTLDSSHGPGKAYYIKSLTRYVVNNKEYRAVVPKTNVLGIYKVSSTGTIISREITQTGGFGASCTDPRDHVWPGHGTYKLVKLTSGSRKGKWINAKYAREL